MEIAYSAVLRFANDRFDSLAAQLAATLRRQAPSGNDGASNLLAEYRRAINGGQSELSAEAWDSTLQAFLAPMIDAIPVAELRLLYLATDNGGDECVRLDDPDEIPLSGPWIAEDVVRRLQLLRPVLGDEVAQ